MKTLLRFIPILILTSIAARSQQPEWIWHTKEAANGEVRYFRKTFTLPAAPKEAKIEASCDNGALVFVNGKQVLDVPDWNEPRTADVAAELKQGENVIAVRGHNKDGVAALIVRLEITLPDGKKQTVVTDQTWQSAEKEEPGWKTAGFDASAWGKPFSFGKLGVKPWGNVFAGPATLSNGRPTQAKVAAEVDQLETLPGFKIERIRVADRDTEGSWICLAKDNKGRLLIGAQRGQPITRITLKDGKVENAETLNLGVSEAMGMLYTSGSLFVDGFGKKADGSDVFGLWRLRDTDGEGAFDKPELIREWEHGTGDHGGHAILLGPDKKLYTVCGNFTEATGMSPNSPHKNFQDDLVLPRAEDGNGFGAGKKPPGGFITRIDPETKTFEMIAAGERNTYDIAFNADGELFGFDSDMEWDWGTPWYRPIRVFHAVSGGDQGFREGTAKWPEYYFDSLPAVVNIGIGCPVGVTFGYGAKFPAKYQRAFFVTDWSYGRLIAVHLKPNGASYTATWENLVEPKGIKEKASKTPLNLTDMLIGDDGALYFTIGGRSTQAALYRVSYVGKESTAPADLHDKDGTDLRALRHKLEAFHGHEDPKAIETSWPELSNPDRFIRYAARIAIEAQPVDQWKSRALSEKNPEAAITALLALSRLGKDAGPDVFKALAKFPIAKLSTEQQLEKLRVIEVCIVRQGKPSDETAKRLAAELDPIFPSKHPNFNRELSQILLALGAPDAVAKTVKLLEAAPTQEEQVGYIRDLRTITTGWTPELRKTYFAWWTKDRTNAQHPNYVTKWFNDAGRDFGNGSSINGFLVKLRRDAIANIPPDELAAIQPVLDAWEEPVQKQRTPKKEHVFVREWKMSDIEPALAAVGSGRNFARGQDAFTAVQCLLCHKFGNDGGAVGPELTAVSSRFSRRDILESILEPSKVISEQYANTDIYLKSGDMISARIVSEDAGKLVVRISPLAPDTQEIKKSDIKSRELSKVSPMPPGLVNILSKDEILDLLAYIESGGRKDAANFKK